MSAPTYACTNEDCEDEGMPIVPERGAECVCPTCGWFMTAIDADDAEYV
jgi:hypothetical protein